MAWETRSNGRKYLYRSYRDAEGKVRKRYLGIGERAQAALEYFEAQKEAKRARQLESKRICLEQQELDKHLTKIHRITNQLVAVALLQAGFHNPKSRGLRRKRIANEQHEAIAIEVSKARKPRT